MSLDSAARKVAKDLTDKFGKSVTLRRVTQDAYDPTAGTGGDSQAPTDYAVKVTPPQNFMFTKIDGTLIKEGDHVVRLPALDSPIVPDQFTDTVIIDSKEWSIKQIGEIWSGEQVAMYILHLTGTGE